MTVHEGTKYMSSGAAYGRGIYMADSMSVSMRYTFPLLRSGGGDSRWPNGSSESAVKIIAVCEVVDRYVCMPLAERVVIREDSSPPHH